MGVKYTRKLTEEHILEAIKDMTVFYRAKCVNRTGKTNKSDGEEYYREIISEYLLKNFSLFDQIKTIHRGNYKRDTHGGITINPSSNRKEEHIAHALFRKGTLSPLGRVIDYQVPLKSKQSDNAGKFDLIAFDEATGILRLIELKAPTGHDSLLRCVLEIYTYFRTVDINTLISNYEEIKDKCKEIRLCALFFKNSTQDKEYGTLYESPYFVKLMNKISETSAKVELLRFPFKDFDFAAFTSALSSEKGTQPGGFHRGYDNGTSSSDAHNRGIKPQEIPVVEQPGKFPMDIKEERKLHPELLEVEILPF